MSSLYRIHQNQYLEVEKIRMLIIGSKCLGELIAVISTTVNRKNYVLYDKNSVNRKSMKRAHL